MREVALTLQPDSMSEFVAKAENICSHGLFRILTHSDMSRSSDFRSAIDHPPISLRDLFL